MDLCLSVVEKMDFMQPAEAFPANGRGKRSMATQACMLERAYSEGLERKGGGKE